MNSAEQRCAKHKVLSILLAGANACVWMNLYPWKEYINVDFNSRDCTYSSLKLNVKLITLLNYCHLPISSKQSSLSPLTCGINKAFSLENCCLPDIFSFSDPSL